MRNILLFTVFLGTILSCKTENKKVELKIKSDTFFIKETDKKIVLKTNSKKKKLTIDNTVTDLVDLSKIPRLPINGFANAN